MVSSRFLGSDVQKYKTMAGTISRNRHGNWNLARVATDSSELGVSVVGFLFYYFPVHNHEEGVGCWVFFWVFLFKADAEEDGMVWVPEDPK